LHFAQLLAIVVMVSSCIRPQAHSPAQDPAIGSKELTPSSFNLARVTLKSSVVTSQINGFSIPSEKLYTFEVCVQNKHTRVDVRGEPFTIQPGEQKVRTDDRGCLDWSERLTLNMGADQKFVELKRTVVANGMQSGSREVRLAVNPWDNQDKFFDLDYDKLDESLLTRAEVATASLQGLNADASVASRSLVLGDLPMVGAPAESERASSKAQITSADASVVQGLTRNLTFEIKPKIILKNPYGTAVEYTIDDARLQVDAALIESTTSAGSDSRYAVWQTQKPVAVSREGSVLRASLNIETRQGNPSSHYLLAIRVSPVGAPSWLKPFEGLFELGDYRQVFGAQNLTAKLKESNYQSNFTLAHLAATTHALAIPENSGSTDPLSLQSGALPSGVSRAGPFRISAADITLQVANDISSVRRKVDFKAKVCIVDSTNGDRDAIDIDFVVTKSDGSKVTVRSERYPDGPGGKSQGCISWTESVQHDYYAPEKIFVLPVTISHLASGYSEMRYLPVNPWDPVGFKRDFLDDADRSHIAAVNSRELIPAVLQAQSYSFDAVLRRSYEVDEFMSMTIIKRLRLNIPFVVQRSSSLRFGRSAPSEALRPGVYLFKAALYLKARDAAGLEFEIIEPIRGGSRLVAIEAGGVLRTDVDFEIPDVRLMKARIAMVFQVQPIDETKLSHDDILNLRSPVSNLETLVDRSSSLPVVTFVAPAWIRKDKDAGAPLPSSDISMKLPTLDPDLAQAMKPLIGVSIDTLYSRAAAERQKYHNDMMQFAQLGKFLASSNVDYVTLTHESDLMAGDVRVSENNRILPKSEAAEGLLHILNHRGLAPLGIGAITKKDLLDLVENRRQFDKGFAARFCAALYGESAVRMAPQKVTADLAHHWENKCIEAISKNGPASMFSVDRKLRVFALGSHEGVDPQFRNLDFDINAVFNFGKNHTSNDSFGSGLGVNVKASDVPKMLLGYLGKTIEQEPVLNLITTALGMFGLQVDYSHTETDQVSTSQTSTAGGESSLDMEQVELGVNVSKYEQCIAIRPNLSALESDTTKVLWLATRLGQDFSKVASRGIVICTGYVNHHPITVRERYYVFAQSGFAQTQTVLDEGDLRIQPWLVSIRGQRDYARFLLYLGARLKSSPGSDQSSAKIDIGELPLERLKAAYNQYLRGATVTLPGFVSVEPTLQWQKETVTRPAAPSSF
jgi:hypothetical protein